MAATVWERHGSREFDAGVGGGSGRLLFAVLAADSEDHAVALALAEPIVQPVINGYLLESWAVTDQGGTNYFVDVSYKRGVPELAAANAGEPPAEARPSPPGGQPGAEPLTRDISFTMGGETKRIYQLPPGGSTRHKIAKLGDTAPDFGGLIGVTRQSDGKYSIEGCDVVSPTADFSITKRFASLSLAWFRHNLDLVATVNSVAFLNCDELECLYLGADGQFKDGDDTPWTVTGRWKYSRNQENVVIGELTIPDIPGHSYYWQIQQRKEETVTHNGVAMAVIIEYPMWGYCEDVYEPKDHNSLGFN